MDSEKRPAIRKGSVDGSQPAPARNLTAIPAYLLKDAIALSKPVTEEDEPLLIEEIIKGLNEDKNYKDILNGLHGKNMHAVSLWKDYYLEHKQRIDPAVRKRMRNQAVEPIPGWSSTSRRQSEEHQSPLYPTIRKTSPASFKVGSSSARTSPASTSGAPAKRQRTKSTTPKAKEPTPVALLTQAVGGRRATLNSLTAPTPVFNSHLPAPNSEIKIPDPPSRSPSPPTRVVPGYRGNRYTEEDREYFIKFIQWELQKDPTLGRSELCERIALKAPHHTAGSWTSHWSNNHDLPDKILSAAHERLWAQPNGAENGNGHSADNVLPLQRPNYAESSTDDDEDDNDFAADRRSESSSAMDSTSDDEPLNHYREDQMGRRNEPFTDADTYFIAKHIARSPNWHNATFKEKWRPLGEMYPQRSDKSWQEYYRRSKHLINRVVRKIEKEDQRSQRAYPSGAKPRSLKRPADHMS